MDFGYQSRDIDYIIDWAKLSILYTKGYAHSRFNWRLSFTKIKKWKQQRIKPELLSFFYVKTTGLVEVLPTCYLKVFQRLQSL